jgi:hypothetical protein
MFDADGLLQRAYRAGFAKRTLVPSIGKIISFVVTAYRNTALDRDSKVWPETAYRTLSSVSSALKPSRLLTYIAFALWPSAACLPADFQEDEVEREWVEVALLFYDSLLQVWSFL